MRLPVRAGVLLIGLWCGLAGPAHAAYDGVLPPEVALTTVGAQGLALVADTDPGGTLRLSRCADAPCSVATSRTIVATQRDVRHVALATGADGRGVLAWLRDDVPDALFVARCADETCTSLDAARKVAGDGFGDSPLAMTMTPAGLSLLAYRNRDDAIVLLRCADAACATTVPVTIDTAFPNDTLGLAVTPEGAPVLTYAKGRKLSLARCSDPTCSSVSRSTVPTGAEGANGGTAVAIGADGLPVIGFHDHKLKHLNLARCASASCAAATVTRLASGPLGEAPPRLVVGPDGVPVAAYDDDRNLTVKVARCSDRVCTQISTTVIDRSPSGAEFGAPAPHIAADGRLLVAASTLVDFPEVRLGSCPLASCIATTVTTVAPGAYVGTSPSVAIGADGRGIVAYRDESRGDLRVAKCLDAACASARRTTLDAKGDVGYFTSVAVGADGRPMVAYHDGTRGDLVVARCSDSACSARESRTVLDRTGDVGEWIDTAFGSDGRLRIAYQDATKRDLKLARCLNAACTKSVIRTLMSRTIAGEHASIVVGTGGRAYIAHHDQTDNALRVVRCADSRCTASSAITLARSGRDEDNGLFPSVALDSRRRPVVAHINVFSGGEGGGPNFSTHYARCADTRCVRVTTAEVEGRDYNQVVLVPTSSAPLLVANGGATPLRVLRCRTTSCRSTTAGFSESLAADIGVGDADAALGRDGRALVAYPYDGNLRVAHCTNAACTTAKRSTVDSNGNDGRPSGLPAR